MQFIATHHRKILYSFIVFLALFLRTYNYENRINVENDNSRDVIVGQYSKDTGSWPLIGQWTSAGPFFYGPWWYWTLSLIGHLPFGELTYWYAGTAFSLIFLWLLFKTAREIGGERLGAIALVLGSVSYAQVGNALNIWNVAIIPLLTLLTLYLSILWYKKRNTWILMGVGFTWGLAMTIHFQILLTLPVLLIFLLIARPNFKQFLLCISSLLIPFIPLFIFDLKFNFFNIRNVYWYLTEGQYAIWVPNRWLTYAFDYWPKTWSRIIGNGQKIMGIGTIVLVVLATLFDLKNIRKHKFYYVIASIFVLEVILFRYYRGERFVYYSIFAHAPVLLITAWMIERLFHVKKIIGLTILGIIVGISLFEVVKSFHPGIMTYTYVREVTQKLYREYPNQKFAIYGCKESGYIGGYALAYFVYRDGRSSPDGTMIGTCFGKEDPVELWPLIPSDADSTHSNWYNKSVPHVYEDTVEWWIKNPPKPVK